ncbi:MAG: N-acetylmuramoyl-L-alanine amidase [Faecousia sp.]
MKKEYKSLAVLHILVLLGMLMIGLAGEGAVTVIAENKLEKSRHQIIIDAGHGGIDGGAVSCTGVLESGINLEIALRLQDLSHLLGYDTVMIRTTDISIHTSGQTIAQKKISDLKERVRIINSVENGVLLSIHQNYFPDDRYSGAQVFYNGDEESAKLANILQDSFIAALNPGSNRKVKKAKGIFLMEHIDCTGVLIECGFLSNYQEEMKLRSEEYQKQLCCVIIAGLSQYLNT